MIVPNNEMLPPDVKVAGLWWVRNNAPDDWPANGNAWEVWRWCPDDRVWWRGNNHWEPHHAFNFGWRCIALATPPDPTALPLPRVPRPAMLKAACQAMRLRQEAMGGDWVRVPNTVKARLRYEAMVAAWDAEVGGVAVGQVEVLP